MVNWGTGGGGKSYLFSFFLMRAHTKPRFAKEEIEDNFNPNHCNRHVCVCVCVGVRV